MLKPGDVVGRYTIESLLGEGGMGSVYRAEDGRLGRRVALKVVKLDGAGEAERVEATARLVREARAAAALDHPNAVAMFDIGEHEGTAFIAMELVPGRTLREALEDPSVGISERIRWMADVARALGAAHRAGLVHRDVKPENVMVRDDGVVKVLDFGIARRGAFALDASAPTQSAAALGTLTSQGLRVGTPLYMAPEQIRGDAIDGRADQFAWGVVAYEVFTRRVPWRKDDALTLVATILTEPARPLRELEPEVPELAERVVMRALSKAKDERYASMDDLVRALEGSASLRPSLGGAPAPSGPKGDPTDSRRFSDAEIRRVLERAVERQHRPQASDSSLSYAELVDVARQIGVDESALAAAARELDPPPPRPAHPPSAARDAAIAKMTRNAATYGVVCLFMFLLDLRDWHIGFSLWVLAGCSLAVALQAVRIWFPNRPWPLDPPRPDPPAQARPITARSLDEGLAILKTARNRVAPLPGSPGLRVPEPNGAHAAAEREAAAESEAAQAARRAQDR